MENKTSKYEIQKAFIIWNNKTGERIIVGEDDDALDLISIKSKDSLGATLQEIVFTREQAPFIIKSLEKYLAQE